MSKREEITELLKRVKELEDEIREATTEETKELAVEYKGDLEAIIAYVNETKRLKARIKEVGSKVSGGLNACNECSEFRMNWCDIIKHHCPLGVICSVYSGDCTLDWDWEDLTREDFKTWFK
ncbi:MAG: hypothetical protein ACRCZ0_00195 [Cetobacterium sp.]